jgi:hypothetical protein
VRVGCLPLRNGHDNAANVIQGTLDMRILRTSIYGPADGHQWKQMAETVTRVMWPVAEES